MDPHNPYAPPRADVDHDLEHGGRGGGVERDGELARIPVAGASFPARCVVCNATASERLGRKLYWHSPWVYALVLSPVIYAIVAVVVRKVAIFELGLCSEHAARRRNGNWLAGLGTPGFFVASVIVAETSGVLSLLCVLAGLASLFVGFFMARVVTVSRIHEGWAWLKVGRPFLDSL